MGATAPLTIADGLAEQGRASWVCPRRSHNDLDRTFTTFGFDTAVSFATDCIDRPHATAASHHRIIVVEVMERYAGWIALHAGMAASAHAILRPSCPLTSTPWPRPSPAGRGHG